MRRGLAAAGGRVWVAAGSGAAAWLAVPAGIDVLAGVVSPSLWVQADAANRSSRNDQCCGKFILELQRVSAGSTLGGVGINDIKLVCHRGNIKNKLASLLTAYPDVEA